MARHYPDEIQAIAKRVRAHRKAAGLTQELVAEKCGLQVETISRVESGRTTPSLETLLAMADALECGVADFVDPKRPVPTSPLTSDELEALRLWREMSARARRAWLSLAREQR